MGVFKPPTLAEKVGAQLRYSLLSKSLNFSVEEMEKQEKESKENKFTDALTSGRNSGKSTLALTLLKLKELKRRNAEAINEK